MSALPQAGEIYLLEGEDPALLSRQVNKLLSESKAAGLSGEVRRFSAKGLRLEAFLDTWLTPSFFGSERLVLSGCEGWKKADWESFLALAEAHAGRSSHVLLVTATALDKRFSAVKSLVSRVRYIEVAAPKPRDWPRWVVQVAASDFSLSLHEQTALLLGEVAGREPVALLGALAQLALYVWPKQTVTEQDVAACLGSLRQEDIFALVDASAAQNAPKALALLGNLNEREADPLYLLAMLRRHFRIAIQLKEDRTSSDPAARARRVGVSPYFLKQYEAAATRYSEADLRGIYAVFATLDQRLKSESIPPLLAMTELLLKLGRKKA